MTSLKALSTIKNYAEMIDMIYHKRWEQIFLKVLTGQILTIIVPAKFWLLYAVFDNLDLIDREIKRCIKMIEDSKRLSFDTQLKKLDKDNAS